MGIQEVKLERAGERSSVDGSLSGPQTTIRLTRVGGKSSVIAFIITRRKVTLFGAGDYKKLQRTSPQCARKRNSGLWTRVLAR